MRNLKATFGAAVAALAVGCAQLPERIETLDQAREAVGQIEQDPLAQDVSQNRYERARSALARAEELYDENEDLELIEHEAYVALRNAQIVEQQTAEQRAREELEQGEAERNRVVLQAREREAERAAELAEQRGEALEVREAELEQQARAAEEAEQRAQELEQERQQFAEQAEELEQQLTELEAQETERGWVMTLSDVLFDFDKAELNPGAEQTLDRLAQFLNDNPDRSIVIEGHTDSSGAATYNRELSLERAEAVRSALMARGVAGGRIELRPLGEEFPVATNDTTAGRQLNRRVEIVFSDEEGRFAGEQRTATAEPTEQEE